MQCILRKVKTTVENCNWKVKINAFPLFILRKHRL